MSHAQAPGFQTSTSFVGDIIEPRTLRNGQLFHGREKKVFNVESWGWGGGVRERGPSRLSSVSSPWSHAFFSLS